MVRRDVFALRESVSVLRSAFRNSRIAYSVCPFWVLVVGIVDHCSAMSLGILDIVFFHVGIFSASGFDCIAC